MSRPTFKQYLQLEYDRYFNSFSEVIDKEDDPKTKIDSPTRDGKEAQKKQRDCEELEAGDGEEDYDPCRFRQWMEISIAGEN